MDGLMRMLEGFKFGQQNPLAELQIPINSVFPTILAIIENKLSENMRDEIYKNKQLLVETKNYFSQPEKTLVSKKIDKQIAKNETNTYALVYYNPESKKAELVEETVSLNYEDTAQQILEEGLGQRSTYGLYSFIVAQIIKEQIDEPLLREIMARIKIEQPDPFGGGTAIQVNYAVFDKKTLEKYSSKIIALNDAQYKKAELEEKIAAHIELIDKIVENMQHTNSDMLELIMKLPPLSRERMLALFRKKKISKKQIVELLLKDNTFLKAVKEKTKLMDIIDILQVVQNLKK
ncbi:MAG: hypothetical protein AB1391_03420 [Candidatus Micrarchaeota archaeon]